MALPIKPQRLSWKKVFREAALSPQPNFPRPSIGAWIPYSLNWAPDLYHATWVGIGAYHFTPRDAGWYLHWFGQEFTQASENTQRTMLLLLAEVMDS